MLDIGDPVDMHGADFPHSKRDLGDHEVVLGAGGYITKPRHEMHAMWNAGDVPARMIEVISPAGLENFFKEVSELLTSGTPDMAEIAALAANYGLQFGEPAWLPDVVSRYRLTPPLP